MDNLHQYTGNLAPSPGWWAGYRALMIIAVAAMLGGMRLGIARASAPRATDAEQPDTAA